MQRNGRRRHLFDVHQSQPFVLSRNRRERIEERPGDPIDQPFVNVRATDRRDYPGRASRLVLPGASTVRQE